MAEIELKLAAAKSDLPALTRALDTMAKHGNTTTLSLISTYYDTPDLQLRRHNMTLRVREQTGQYIQTVKAGDLMGQDLVVRGEWEDVIAGNRPDLNAPETARSLRGKVKEGQLRPLFKTIVGRTVIELEPRQSTRVEAAIDEGEIRGMDGNAVEPVSEIELELKSGDRAAL